MQEPSPPDLRRYTPVFFAIHLAGGHIGLPILVATFLFSKTTKRHPSVINFCITWILYSIVYCLLIYGGDAWLSNPPYELCLVQAAMNYASPPMAVVAGLGVVLQIWGTFVEPWKETRLANIPRWLRLALIILPPYLTFVGFAIAAGVIGLKNPQWVVVKNGLYCGLIHGHFEMFAVPIFCTIFLALIIGFEIASLVRYFYGRRIVKKVFPLVNRRKPSISPLCRAALFLVYASLVLGACLMDLRQEMSTFGYMIQGSLPLAAFLIFGLQKDVALAWFSWNRKGWNPADSPGTSGDSHRITRFPSMVSTTTIDSTTPIATYPSSSMV